MKINKLLESKKLKEGITNTEPVVKFQGKSSHTFTKDKKWEVDFDEAGNILARTRHGKPSYFKGHINDKTNDFPSTDEDNIILAAREQHGLKFGKKTESFEKDGGPFWYFTKHGMGPGMLPKGVNVVDTIEDDNFGTYIALDKVLTTQELKDYELKEKKPDEYLLESKKLKESYIVDIVYDSGKHKAQADDGIHGKSWVDFPKHMLNYSGQQYEVDKLLWNGTNYTVDGSIKYLNKPKDDPRVDAWIAHRQLYKEGLSHFEFTSGSNPYIAKTKSEVDRIKRSRGDSVRYVGSINGIDYYKVDDSEEDLFKVDESVLQEADNGKVSASKWYASQYPDDEVGIEQLDGLYLDDILKDRKLVGHCDTQVRDRVYAQLDKYSPRILDVKELDDGKKWQYSIGGKDVPYTSYEDAKAHMKDDYKITDYRDELQKYIDKETGRPHTFFVDETFDDRLVISINWGDWKHEHGYADYLVKKFFMDKGLGIEVEREITDEDGSDTYSADHYYDINDISFSGRVIDESKESEESELITQYINNGEFDKLEKVKDGTNVVWKLKDNNLKESIEVETIGDYITDHYDFDDIDDKYSCINSIKDSFKDKKTISKEELEQFIGSHNGKDKVNESLKEDVSPNTIKEIEWLLDGIINIGPDDKINDQTDWKRLYTTASRIKKQLDKETLKESKATHCVYFSMDGGKTQEIEFEGTEDECQDYIEKQEAENEFGDEAPERFVKRINEARRKASDPKQIQKAEAAMFDSLMCGSYNTEMIMQEARMIYGITYQESMDAFRKAYNRYMIESGELDENLLEGSYGGAFDIADDQYFTREDLDSFAEEVLNHINETFKTQFDIASCYIDDGVLEVCVTNDEYGDYIHSEKIDMRKIKEPWHLKRVYAFEFASQLINDITQTNDGLVESVYSSSHEFDDDVDALSYYYNEEDIRDALNDVWEEKASKSVPDSDGFMTDYTMYRNINTGEYVFVFGDKDIYRPEDGYFDWECETEQEATEWFDNYNGFDDFDDETFSED